MVRNLQIANALFRNCTARVENANRAQLHSHDLHYTYTNIFANTITTRHSFQQLKRQIFLIIWATQFHHHHTLYPRCCCYYKMRPRLPAAASVYIMRTIRDALNCNLYHIGNIPYWQIPHRPQRIFSIHLLCTSLAALSERFFILCNVNSIKCLDALMRTFYANVTTLRSSLCYQKSVYRTW